MSKPLGGWCKFLWPSQKSWTLHTPKKHQMLQSDVGFLDCQKCAGTQPPKATSLDRKKPPWGTFPVFPLPCNTPPIVYVKKKLYLHDIFCRYTIFYTIVVLAWGGNRDIKRPNSFVTNRPHNGFKAFMKLHMIFHHTSACKSDLTNVNTMKDKNSNAISYWLWSQCAPPRPTSQ